MDHDVKQRSSGDAQTGEGVREFELPADLAAVLSELERIAGGSGKPVVDDAAVLRSLWATRFPPGVERLADAIDRLVALRYVRRVFIGSEPHLIPGSRPVVQRSAGIDESAAPSLDDEVFRLELAGDAEHEKVILYRVVIVLELIAALLLLRQLFIV